jgi:putative tricarboxylic transport membrane protein
MIALGIFGWLLKATGFPRAPFLIGFVLAIPLERYYFLTDSLYDGLDWMARPGVLIFLAILILPILWSLIKYIRARQHTNTDDGHRDEQPEEDESPLKESIWSLSAAAIFLLVFAGALISSSAFSPEARLVPQLISTGGLIFSAIMLASEIRSRLQSKERRPGWTLDAGFALKTFLWMIGFLTLIAIFGYLIAVTIFIPAFLLLVARARLKVTVIYTLVFFVILVALPSLLPIDLPQGWLNTLV